MKGELLCERLNYHLHVDYASYVEGKVILTSIVARVETVFCLEGGGRMYDSDVSERGSASELKLYANRMRQGSS